MSEDLYICPHCSAVIEESELGYRHWEGREFEPPEDWVLCPECGEEIGDDDKVRTCKLCGEPIIHEKHYPRKCSDGTVRTITVRSSEGDLCDECKEAIDKAFYELLDKLSERANTDDKKEIQQAVMDRAEYQDFYWGWADE